MVEIKLAGPGKNALGTKMIQSVLDQVDAADGAPILFTGDGDAFSAGLNLKEVESLDSDGMELTHELAIALNEEKLEKYLDSFTAHNLYKLGSAITKHITSEMEPLGDVHVDEGMKGIEIWTPISTPEGRRIFKARCILAGGPMVRYHYRYISHLVKEDR